MWNIEGHFARHVRPGDDFMLVNDRSQNLLQLRPPLGHDLTWPPKFVFGDEAYERFSIDDAIRGLSVKTEQPT